MIYPWQIGIWKRLVERLDRLPHALLFSGPAGGGKTRFADAFAARLLCEQPGQDGFACGKCPACLWLEAGNHPDYRLVTPESEQDAAAEEGSDSDAVNDAGSKQKKASSQILIDQIRALGDFVAIGTHRQGRRVIVIRPAEAMNASTANSLLKLLEEPTSSTYFILITSHPARLLATIRSRCQSVAFRKPDRDVAAKWLSETGVRDAEALLAFAGGMPLQAAELAAGELSDLRRRFIAELQGVSSAEALRIAANWDARLGGKKGDNTLDLPLIVTWMQKWVVDLALVKLSVPPIFHPQLGAALQSTAEAAAISSVFACYNDLARARAVAQHPLNSRLFLEDMLLRYARAVGV